MLTMASSKSSAAKYPIASLPLVAPSDRLTQSLTPEDAATSVKSFQKETLVGHPSLLRMSRIIPPSVHFSFTTPYPMPFPYRIPAADASAGQQTRADHIENWLSQREPLVAEPKAPLQEGVFPQEYSAPLQKLSSNGKNESVEQRYLLALSKACIDDCLPALDAGDAFDVLSPPSSEQDPSTTQAEQRQAAHQELVDVLCGHSSLMTSPDSDGAGFAPWSLRYCGHQFGVWAGQLGDGRAVSICAFYYQNLGI